MANFSVVTDSGLSFDAIKADLLLPYFGNWTAYVVIESVDDEPSGGCTVSCLGTEFRGYIYPSRSKIAEGRYYCMIVGGNGGLVTAAQATSFNYQLTRQSVLTQMLATGSELISPTTSIDYLNELIESWHSSTGTVASQLSDIVDTIGGVWRVVKDGGIFLGTDEFSVSDDFEYEVKFESPVHASATLVVSSISAYPGTRFPQTADYPNLSERKIGACRYIFTPNEPTKLMLWFLEEQGVYTDPLHEGMAQFVKETMRGVEYYKQYACRVVEIRTDGTVDVEPYDEKIPPMTSLPLRTSFGAKYKPLAGENGILLFENGDPRKAVYVVTEMGSGGKRVARQDDEVSCGTIQFSTVANGVLTGTYVDGFGTSRPFVLGDVVTLKGKIKTGHPRVELTGEV